MGTARIGADELSVVDPGLNVHGVEGLQIADASVFPAIPRGNTQATVIALAERAEELILAKTGTAARSAQAPANAGA